ncbi:otu-like cysteine protease domain-containing protein [Cyclospora cayetanensis]|uniref:Otu-like cysteine protease domain-containing protein n=1 Tax=Cyclospora cayetanensis TaxID=88456 RepID=A0A1D3D3Q9_9EIME|nr:otu-like cysteine protease domain-containing protein [Cyclospora cayetanensis]
MGKKKQRNRTSGRNGGEETLPSSKIPSGRSKRNGDAGLNGKKGLMAGGAFAASLLAVGLELRDVVADGNCLFRAASDQLFGEQTQHKKVRAAAVEYMAAHADIFAPFTDCDEEPFARYLRRMAADRTWGGQLELQAISLAFGVNLLIYVAPPEDEEDAAEEPRNASWRTASTKASDAHSKSDQRKGKCTGRAKSEPSDVEAEPQWKLWRMQNFDAKAVCLQVAFHPDTEHYSSPNM